MVGQTRLLASGKGSFVPRLLAWSFFSVIRVSRRKHVVLSLIYDTNIRQQESYCSVLIWTSTNRYIEAIDSQLSNIALFQCSGRYYSSNCNRSAVAYAEPGTEARLPPRHMYRLFHVLRASIQSTSFTHHLSITLAI